MVSRAAQGLATANSGLAEGAAQLATGTSQVSSGADSLSTAAGRLSIGASGVATGTSQVATGAAQTSAGASSLATGLANGAQQVPSYTDDERNALVSVVTTPVDVGSTADNPATVAASLIPVVLGLVLWLGTLMMFLTGTSVPDGPAWGQASPGPRVLARWLPAALVGVLQAAVVIALVAVSGVSISSPVGLVGIAVLGTVAFAATNQALVSMFGGVGRMVSLAFVAVQAAAFGGLIPIETAPAALQTLNGVLPLPQFVAGASRFLLGGGGDVVSPCLVLIGWTVIALLVSVAFAARRRLELAGVARPPSTAGPSTLSLAAEGA